MEPQRTTNRQTNRGFVVLVVSVAMAACAVIPPTDPTSPSLPVYFSESRQFANVTESEQVTIDGGAQVAAAKNEVLIYLDDDVTQEEFDRIHKEITDDGAAIIGSLLETRTLQIRVPDDTDEFAFASQFTRLSGVSGAGPNLQLEFSDAGMSNNEGHELSVNADYPAFVGSYWIEQTNMNQAWAISQGNDDPRAIIGIVDTGIPASQTVVDEHRIRRFTATGAPMSDDDSSSTHGTLVTCYSAANSPFTRGVAWNNQVVIADVGRPRASGKTYITSVQSGIATAIKEGADVINISIGAKTKDMDDTEKAAARQRFRDGLSPATRAANQHDALLVFSAGNDAYKSDDQLLPTEVEMGSADAWNTNSLIVAAVDRNSREASSTRMGRVVDLAAPGVGVGCGLGRRNGTSYAASFVTGTAALLRSINPTLSAPELRFLILDSATRNVLLADGSHPRIQLNAGQAATAAELTVDASLENLSPVPLRFGESQAVRFSVVVPSTGVAALDVLLLVDVSVSYHDDIATLQAQATQIIDGLHEAVPNVRIGVATFSDFPISPYGNSSDRPFNLNQPITDDESLIHEAIDVIAPLDGGDGSESQLEALYQAATASGRDVNYDGDYDDPGAVLPGPMGWRAGALKVILFATDAPFHDSDTERSYPGRGFSETIDALNEAGISVIGLQSGFSSPAELDMRKIVDATDGLFFQLSADSAEISDTIASGLRGTLANVDLVPEIVGGSEWVTSISPSRVDDVERGRSVTFLVNLTGGRRSTFLELDYAVYVWVWGGDQSALMKRVMIPIAVPKR